MKTCCRCRQEQPAEDFSRRSAAPDGLAPHCKSCDRVALESRAVTVSAVNLNARVEKIEANLDEHFTGDGSVKNLNARRVAAVLRDVDGALPCVTNPDGVDAWCSRDAEVRARAAALCETVCPIRDACPLAGWTRDLWAGKQWRPS